MRDYLDEDAPTKADEVASQAVLAGRYHIVRQLGSGGMGSVWLAEDGLLDNKTFAIKMLPSVLVSNKRAYQQLKREALVAMKLTHQNIVTLRAFEENDGNPFLVMDYIDGRTLDEYISVKGRLSVDEAASILRPIAVALDYAHSKGVIHRDVKPSNVMLASDGTPYILDFGIAREILEGVTLATGVQASGTLQYMSPEQLHGAKPSPMQDIYSFAAMAYECLVGEPPFCRGLIEHQIDNDEPAPIPPQSGVYARMPALIMAGLSKNPAGRPESCEAVLGGGGKRVKEVSSHQERLDGGTGPCEGPGHTAASVVPPVNIIIQSAPAGQSFQQEQTHQSAHAHRSAGAAQPIVDIRKPTAGRRIAVVVALVLALLWVLVEKVASSLSGRATVSAIGDWVETDETDAAAKGDSSVPDAPRPFEKRIMFNRVR